MTNTQKLIVTQRKLIKELDKTCLKLQDESKRSNLRKRIAKLEKKIIKEENK